MRVGILLPGFSSDETDWAIPVQLNLVRVLAQIRQGQVEVVYHPPIPVAGPPSRKAMATRCEAAVKAGLIAGLPEGSLRE